MRKAKAAPKARAKKGTAPIVHCRLRREQIPGGLKLLKAKNRNEFFELTGIKIPEDIEFDLGCPSRKLEAIIETLSRLKEGEKHEQNPNH